MARQGISKNQVFEAATALHEAGIAPTVQQVRERLGTGSYSTISAHLNDWKVQTTGQAPAEIPPIPEQLQAAFQQIWASATRAAQAEVATQKEALEAMRREMDRERTELSAEIARLESRLDEASEQADALRVELGAGRQASIETERQLTELRIDNARWQERAQGADKRAAELKRQLDDLHERWTAAIEVPDARPKAPSRKR